MADERSPAETHGRDGNAALNLARDHVRDMGFRAVKELGYIRESEKTEIIEPNSIGRHKSFGNDLNASCRTTLVATGNAQPRVLLKGTHHGLVQPSVIANRTSHEGPTFTPESDVHLD